MNLCEIGMLFSPSDVWKTDVDADIPDQFLLRPSPPHKYLNLRGYEPLDNLGKQNVLT